MSSTVRTRIRDHLKKSLRVEDLDDDVDIFDSGLVDSMFAVQLVAFTEQEFDIIVEDDDLDMDNFRSVDGLTSFVERKSAAM